MNKRHHFIMFIVLVLLITGCSNFSSSNVSNDSNDNNTSIETVYPIGKYVQKNISQINTFPSFPNNYKFIDFSKIAKELDSLVFNFANDSEA